MRLINVRTLRLREFWDHDIPPYTIASHRWGDNEPTFRTFDVHRLWNTEGYQKVVGFCSVIRSGTPHIEWLWIDTCCIDKTNSVELATAINSMFKWYRNATICLAYLRDIVSDLPSMILRSVWFTRCWTLQELLAPSKVLFLNRDWAPVGYKGDMGLTHLRQLNSDISHFTGIPQDVLDDIRNSTGLSVDGRLSWMASRQATRPEDKYYSMLGIFGVSMLPNYGEGAEQARRRLMREIREAEGRDEDPYLTTSDEDPLDRGSADDYVFSIMLPPLSAFGYRNRSVGGYPRDLMGGYVQYLCRSMAAMTKDPGIQGTIQGSNDQSSLLVACHVLIAMNVRRSESLRPHSSKLWNPQCEHNSNSFSEQCNSLPVLEKSDMTSSRMRFSVFWLCYFEFCDDSRSKKDIN